MDLTILIITKNAAETLAETLKSVIGFTREIVIIDDYSSDATREIAQAYQCRIVKNHMENFGEQRSFALSQVVTEWTLVLDSDEVLTEKNKVEIAKALEEGVYNGYYLYFRNHLFGKKLTHGELHKKLVLFKTKLATSSHKFIHEEYYVKGTVGELKEDVQHFSYRSFSQIFKKFFDYSIRQAKQFKKEKKRYGLRELLLNPLHMFYARFIQDGGYKDGCGRIILDLLFAKMEFFSYFFTPFVKEKKRISVDCGSYPVNGIVRSGIDRVIQGIHSQADVNATYYWFSFHKDAQYRLPTRFYSSVWLPLFTLFHRCDVFMGTSGTIPWILQFFPIKKILFLYDFGFFSSPEKYISSAVKLQSQTNSSIKIADRIVVLHDEIYKEFIKRYPHESHKVVVIPAGADHLDQISEIPMFIQPKSPLVLFVGVVKPVKRIDKILAAVGDHYCVIAGNQEQEYVTSLHIKKTQNIQFIKNFNDGQLKWLYKHADVMIYTSEHEGFCYPVLEALNFGLPVIALDLPIFREYKKYFPHLTLVSHESEIKETLDNKEYRKNNALLNHPYRWRTFNAQLQKSIGAVCTPPGCARPRVAFIVVLYKTPIEERERLEKEINNLGIKDTFIYWIDNSTNGKGYAAGINEGICAGLYDKCDYFFALNPDISLVSFAQDKLLTVAQVFDVWGYGMRQGKDIFYGGEIDTWRLSGGLIQTKPHERFSKVNFISGSVMGFTREVVNTIGQWDESYFMYYEDVDYCMRAKKAGFTVGIDSHIIYDHFEVSQYNKKKAQWIAKSRWKFFWKYANWLQIIREIIRLPKTMLVNKVYVADRFRQN
jgi:GT2 family glycosyltransferase/glycosyltransferase involved in cell wall biosynthesis